MGGTKVWAEPGETSERPYGAWRDKQGAGPSQGRNQGRWGGVACSLTLGTRAGIFSISGAELWWGPGLGPEKVEGGTLPWETEVGGRSCRG